MILVTYDTTYKNVVANGFCVYTNIDEFHLHFVEYMKNILNITDNKLTIDDILALKVAFCVRVGSGSHITYQSVMKFYKDFYIKEITPKVAEEVIDIFGSDIWGVYPL